ncbi:unnamed protein product [Sphagnum troendelagicum]|uniref:Annexin n=1 Tax=Sphagnum troendelagicum TaxID=128251 RepID=A0ABP0UKM2_9BRYO
MGTLSLPQDSNLQEDCKDLRSAFKVLGCNEKKVIDILGRRTSAQRMEIAKAYQTVYGESLHKRLKSSFSGKLEKAMLLWMMDPAERDAVLLYECTKPGGTKGDHALLGILCTRNSAQLYLIKQAYYTMFNETLENHIDGCDTSIAADFQNKLLLAFARGNRPEGSNVDRHIALNDAHQLHKVCSGKMGNEDTTIRILSTRSCAQLTATFNYYHQHYGHDFEKALKKDKKDKAGEFEKALWVAVDCLRERAKYFAQELSTALGEEGTDDDTLIRVIISRCEIDMQYIKLEFANESKRSLDEAIGRNTSGNYRNFLLTLIGHCDLGLYSPRRFSNVTSSYYSPQSSTSQQPSNGSASFYSPRSSGHGSFN